MRQTNFAGLEEWQRQLLLRAEAVMKNAYNLYSHFYVGAAVLCDDGEVFPGTFAENSSQITTCAERAAILAANTTGKRFFKAIAVIGGAEKFDALEPVMPCGACRQFIYDFAQIGERDIQLICANTAKDKVFVTSISELLPYPFGPRDSGQDLTRFRKQ